MEDRSVHPDDDVPRMLDGLLAGRGGGWWDEFFSDRSNPCSFFVEGPDEDPG